MQAAGIDPYPAGRARTFRKLRIGNSVAVDGVNAHHRASILRDHENTKIFTLLKLVAVL